MSKDKQREIAVFPDCRARSYSCLMSDVLLLQHAKKLVTLRPIYYAGGGTPERQLVAHYQLDVALTPEENGAACFKLLCKLAGVNYRDCLSTLTHPDVE